MSCLGARKVVLDNVGLRVQGENWSRDRETFGGKCGQGSRAREVQYFQQFKLIDLCVREIRKRTEEFFAYDVVPRGIEEAMAMCERELEE